jgi:diaminopimelate decarboxylase
MDARDVFNQRISLEEAAEIFQAASRSELVRDVPSIIVHHLGLMRARIGALQHAFPKNTLHAVAIKANPLVEVLCEVVATGAGLEAASIEEVHLGLAAGCPAERLVYDSPAKTVREIEEALRLGVYLNADNFEELERIAAARGSVDTQSVVGLRVNTMVGGGAIEHTSVSRAGSKFGVPLSTDRERIIAAFAKYPWLSGLHVHVGSQGCRLALLAEAVDRISALRLEIAAETGRSVTHLDIGGGLSTIYRTGETAPTPDDYRGLLEDRSAELFAGDVRLITEFGRAIHANCGIALSRVEYVKPEQRLAVIHLGADFLLRPVYRPQDWSHEFFVLDACGNPKKSAPQSVSIAGPLCFAGDVIAHDIELPPIDVGDWIAIRDVGAYTLGMWSRHCSRAIPAVFGYDPQQREPLRLLRRGERPEDVVRFWSNT